MGKINLGRVVLGGLLAGVVMNIFDWLTYGVWLTKDMAAAMQALGKPGSMDNLIPWFVFLDFLYGVVLVWVYAAIRPRFGAGPKTGVVAGLAVWVLISLLHAMGEAPMGLLPQRLFMLTTIVALFQLPIATAVGAYLYKEV